jgi:hypothetical protein
MAKRRKAYRGLPAEHRQEAADMLRGWRRTAQELDRALKADRCGAAFESLQSVTAFDSAYGIEKRHAGAAWYQRKPRPGYVTAAHRAEAALTRRTEALVRAFRAKCLIKR